MSNQAVQKYELILDPKLLKLLGPNLYTNIYYILAELIANAYDADAKNVYIISGPDSIIVEDDGTGMSYEDTKKYLNVAVETRTTKENSYTKMGRRKIGRKGVGKLAALSVSENVLVQTITKGEINGFVLSRNVNKDRLLEPIKPKDIKFIYVKKHGTSIVMKEPQYKLNKSFDTIKRNLCKIFPLVNDKFRIHIIQGVVRNTINSFDKDMIKELGGLIIMGREFYYLSKYFKNDFPGERIKLLEKRDEEKYPMQLKNKDGIEKQYELIIKGWVGAYRSTRGRKSNNFDDFPDNFISLISNNKLGEYNILPSVAKNKLPEVFVVGQLYVDLFEETELPDMALSNRQGYKTDDPRYQKVRSYVSETLLPNIVEIRNKYALYLNAGKANARREKQKEAEAELRKLVDEYKRAASSSATKRIAKALDNNDKSTSKKIEVIIEHEMNAFLPIVKIKKRVDAQKKKILICHTTKDKDIADIIYNLLLFNSVPAEDIIYTNADNEVSRIPEGTEVWDYLREFFVDSYSTEKIFIIYVTSVDMAQSWGAVTEVGAGCLLAPVITGLEKSVV